ncbi:MAG: hypothetical protein ACM32J_08955 [Rhizobacter sp.]
MKNPWLKKNPWLIMWLSGANAVASQARAQASAEATRQARRTIDQGTKDMTRLWTDLWWPAAATPAAPKTTRRSKASGTQRARRR